MSDMCSKCSERFPDLEEHPCFPLDPEPKQHTCVICDEAFPSRNTLHKHFQRHIVATTLPDDNPYECYICGLTCDRGSALASHLAVHAKVVYFCHICRTKCNNAAVFQEHARHHIENKPTECVKCHMEFEGEDKLDRFLEHLEMYSVRDLFSCSKCEKCFDDEESLNAHDCIQRRKKLYFC